MGSLAVRKASTAWSCVAFERSFPLTWKEEGDTKVNNHDNNGEGYFSIWCRALSVKLTSHYTHTKSEAMFCLRNDSLPPSACFTGSQLDHAE